MPRDYSAHELFASWPTSQNRAAQLIDYCVTKAGLGRGLLEGTVAPRMQQHGPSLAANGSFHPITEADLLNLIYMPWAPVGYERHATVGHDRLQSVRNLAYFHLVWGPTIPSSLPIRVKKCANSTSLRTITRRGLNAVTEQELDNCIRIGEGSLFAYAIVTSIACQMKYHVAPLQPRTIAASALDELLKDREHRPRPTTFRDFMMRLREITDDLCH